jgi:hypothetical protein
MGLRTCYCNANGLRCPLDSLSHPLPKDIFKAVTDR